jgi:hypothetical protein
LLLLPLWIPLATSFAGCRPRDRANSGPQRGYSAAADPAYAAGKCLAADRSFAARASVDRTPASCAGHRREDP